jgi:hypothetical protein
MSTVASRSTGLCGVFPAMKCMARMIVSDVAMSTISWQCSYQIGFFHIPLIASTFSSDMWGCGQFSFDFDKSHRGGTGEFTFTRSFRHVKTDAVIQIESHTSVRLSYKLPSEAKRATTT